jgi:hypothetical protein
MNMKSITAAVAVAPVVATTLFTEPTTNSTPTV